jgi:ribonuclease HI
MIDNVDNQVVMENEILVEENYNIYDTIVLYGDGSAGPTNPGFYGSGIHGYIYNSNNVGKKNGDKPNKYVISDIGYIEVEQILKYKHETVIPDFYVNGYFSYIGISTNNVAELNAFIESSFHILSNTNFNFKKVIFKTDSMYLINVVNAIRRDTNKSWVNESTKPNLSSWHVLYDIITNYDKAGITCEIVKVLGHSTSLGNHLADRLALLGRTESTRFKPDNKFELTPAKGYWNVKLDRHPFLSFKQLFFTNSLRDASSENSYAIMNYKTDVEPGKKTHEACFGLVILQDKQDYIESAINAYQSFLKSFSVISTVNLTDLYSQYVINYTSLFGDSPYMFNSKRGVLSLMEDVDVVSEIRPAGLATQAIDKIMGLYTILNEYRNRETILTTAKTYHDITDLMYGVDEKGKPTTLIKGGVNTLDVIINIDGVDTKFPLDLGRDTLERNTFKRMEKNDPHVFIVYNKVTPTYIEYFVLVELRETGDLSIWCNFYNNRIFLPKK